MKTHLNPDDVSGFFQHIERVLTKMNLTSCTVIMYDSETGAIEVSVASIGSDETAKREMLESMLAVSKGVYKLKLTK